MLFFVLCYSVGCVAMNYYLVSTAKQCLVCDKLLIAISCNNVNQMYVYKASSLTNSRATISLNFY